MSAAFVDILPHLKEGIPFKKRPVLSFLFPVVPASQTRATPHLHRR
jgi:hypothetical protein